MKMICFAGSLRRESLNKKYARVANDLLREAGHEAELLDLADYPMPVYDQDIEDKQFPEGVVALGKKLEHCEALVIACPEYNGSIAAALKNTVDWLSRFQKDNFKRKKVLLIGASPGALGATRGLWHSRRPFEVLGCFVYPEMSGLPHANEAFAENGELKEKASRDRLAKLLSSFVD